MAKVKCKVTFHGYKNTVVNKGSNRFDSNGLNCIKVLREHTNLQIHAARDLIKAASLPHTSATVSIDTLKGAEALAKALRAAGLTVAVERL